MFVTFGSTDDEVFSFAEFGLKLSVFNLQTSKSVDIDAPKFYSSGVAQRGFSLRPGTSNLALLTRNCGNDIVSIHKRDNLEVSRSWVPDTVDAQGVAWSPDGRWLAVYESASQGHKVLVYTADGHLYKVWNGPVSVLEEEDDAALGAGVKLFDWDRTGTCIAVGDFSRRVTLLTTPLFTESINLIHPTAITPGKSLQVCKQSPSTATHLTSIIDLAGACRCLSKWDLHP